MKTRAAQAGSLLKNSLIPQHFSTSSICLRCYHHHHHRLFASSGLHDRRSRRNYDLVQRRYQSQFAAAVSAAQNYFTNGKPSEPRLPGGVKIDPFKSVAKEMKFLTKSMRQLVGSGHPVLDTVSKYYTQSEGKYIRPMLVLLMSQATAWAPKTSQIDQPTSHDSIDEPLSPRSVLSDANPSHSSSHSDAAESDILPTQRRLAEITELIHTASLLHDDVIDTSATRRSNPSANIAFGNKMAVLAGDFLLGRASVALARLRNSEVTELLATVIANLIEGEFMQLRNTALDEASPVFDDQNTIDYYLQKTYLKSASLISKSCRAAALLSHSAPDVVEAAYSYGRNLGLAFQLVDDMLDFKGSGEELGKPAGADLELGLATAPLLFAWRSRPELGAMVGRKFSAEGDVMRAKEIVRQSDGLEQTRALAQGFADSAEKAISGFPESEAKTGLQEMCSKVMQRRR